MQQEFPDVQLKRSLAVLATSVTMVATATAASGSMPTVATPSAAVVVAEDSPADRIGSFQVKCRWSHMAPDDPIVAPGERGAAHQHEFFGNVSTDAHSTTGSLRNAGTTCVRPEDKAAYWAPSVYNDGQRVRPNIMVSYYRTGALRDPSVIRAFPRGLRMIAGDGQATSPQPTVVTHWSCASDGPTGHKPPAVDLRGRATAPANRLPQLLGWSAPRLPRPQEPHGLLLPLDRECPRSHPVALPTLKLGFRYTIPGPLNGVTLASGGQLTGHADFWNAWEMNALRDLVERCLHGALRCVGPDL
jgi:hypothetical protein